MKNRFIVIVFLLFCQNLSAQDYKPLGQHDLNWDTAKPISWTVDHRGDFIVSFDQSERSLVKSYSAASNEWNTSEIEHSIPSTNSLIHVITSFNHDGIAYFDEELKLIQSYSAGSHKSSFGKSGGGAGELKKVDDLLIDSEGFIYILNSSAASVDIYSPDGEYYSSIFGAAEAFVKPVAMDLNGRGELYVLDAEGPTVNIFNNHGLRVSTHRSFTKWKGVGVENPKDIAVNKSGEFFILDANNGRLDHFDQSGKVLGSLVLDQSLGQADAFDEIQTYERGLNVVGVLHLSSGKVLEYSYTSLSAERKPIKRTIKIDPIDNDLPFIPRAIALNSLGDRYVIPEENPKIIRVFSSNNGEEKAAINWDFKDLVDIEIDEKDVIYAVDRKQKKLFVFDSSGSFLRELGQEIPEVLVEPVSAVVQSDGDLLVVDKDWGVIHSWNKQGVYQKILTSTHSSSLESISAIALDSKDRIYILDDKQDRIFRAASAGWPLDQLFMEAEPNKPGGKAGSIGGFFTDVLDQIYVLNDSKKQLEVYNWDVQPQLIFRAGHAADGGYSMSNGDRLVFDEGTYTVHILPANGKEDKSFDLQVRPPIPSPTVDFGISEEGLAITFEPVRSVLVTAHGLISEVNGQKEIAVETNTNLMVLNEGGLKDLELRRYGLVSLSGKSFSESSLEFNNYFGLANRQFDVGFFEAALENYNLAFSELENFGLSSSSLSKILLNKSEELSKSGNSGQGVRYLKSAVHLSPKEELEIEKIVDVLFDYFNELSISKGAGAISYEAEQLRKKSSLQNGVLLAVDSLCRKLITLDNMESLDQVISLSRKLIGWNSSDVNYLSQLARSEFRLYELKERKGSTALELELLLSEAQRHSEKAVKILRDIKKDDFKVLLVNLRSKFELGSYSQAEETILRELLRGELESDEELKLRSLLGDVYMAQKKYPQAEEQFQLAVTIAPEELSIALKQIESLCEQGAYKTARALSKERLAKDPVNTNLLHLLGRIEYGAKNYEEASFQLEKAVHSDYTFYPNYSYLAKAFAASRKLNKAIENYYIAIDHQMNELRRIEQSSFRSDEVYEAQSKLDEYCFELGELLSKKGDAEAILNLRKRLVEYRPDDANLLYELGEAAIKADKLYIAIAAYRKAVDIEPNNGAYKKAWEDATRLQMKESSKENAITVLSVETYELFPSLCKNYGPDGSLNIGELVLANNRDVAIRPSSIRLKIDGLMEKETDLSLVSIPAFSIQEIELKALLDEGEILKLTESRQFPLSLEITYSYKGSAAKEKAETNILVNGRSGIRWRDKRSLAAFVSPGDSKLIAALRGLRKSFAENRSAELTSEISTALELYAMLQTNGFEYASDPVQSFELASVQTELLDYLQYPSETIQYKSGDCDDLVTLYAALLENSGVRAGYIDLPGHVMLIFDSGLRIADGAHSGVNSEKFILYDGVIWIPLETTLIGKHGFTTAWEKGANRYREELAKGRHPEVVPMVQARKIYTPSTYYPEGFNFDLSVDDTATEIYKDETGKIVKQLNRSVLEGLKSRYQTEPNNVFVKNEYAQLLARTGQLDKAKSILHEAITISPNNASLTLNLGNVYFLLGDYSSSENQYIRAIDIDSQDADAYMNLCRLYVKLGQKAKARAQFDKAIEISPDIEKFYENLKQQML